MHTVTLNGTTYTLKPGSAAAEAVTRPIKPLRKPALGRSDKRLFPTYHAGVTSSADYVRAYFALNSKPYTAYDKHADHLKLYEPLPDTPAAVYQGLDSVETIE
jgi:hypothetical protein